MKINNYILFLALVLIGCSSGQIEYKPIEKMPVKPSYRLSCSGDSLKFGFRLTESGKVGSDIFMDKIENIKTVVYAGQNPIDSFETKDFSIEKQPFSSNSVSNTFTSFINWLKPKVYNSNILEFNIFFCTEDIYYYDTKNLNSMSKDNFGEYSSALVLNGSYKIINDSTVSFNLEAKRKFIEENEYLPNTELLRIEILTREGKNIYSSNENQDYFQVVKKVLPEEIGETYTYKFIWNGRDRIGAKLPTGNYQVRMIIPSKPAPYITLIPFEWRKK